MKVKGFEYYGLDPIMPSLWKDRLATYLFLVYNYYIT